MKMNKAKILAILIILALPLALISAANDPDIAGVTYINWEGELWAAREGVPLYLLDQNAQLVDFEYSGDGGHYSFSKAPIGYLVVACGNTPWGYVYGARSYPNIPYFGLNIYAYIQNTAPKCPGLKNQVFIPLLKDN